MIVNQGVALDTFFGFNCDCPMRVEARGAEIQFNLGPTTGKLTLLTDEEGLTKFLFLATTVLSRLDAMPPGAEVDIQIPEPSAHHRLRVGAQPDTPRENT